MTEILLVRHAQSANNALPEHQRVSDPGLTELGMRQAEALAEWLSVVGITDLYCSPFRRSLETGRSIADRLGIIPHIRADIFEQGGCYSGYEPGKEMGEPGLSRRQLEAEYAGWVVDQAITDAGWWTGGYESYAEAELRAQQVVDWMHAELVPTQSRICLIIHADFKLLLLQRILVQLLQAELPPSALPLRNTGVTKFVWRNEECQLELLNATHHLPPNLIT